MATSKRNEVIEMATATVINNNAVNTYEVITMSALTTLETALDNALGLDNDFPFYNDTDWDNIEYEAGEHLQRSYDAPMDEICVWPKRTERNAYDTYSHQRVERVNDKHFVVTTNTRIEPTLQRSARPKPMTKAEFLAACANAERPNVPEYVAPATVGNDNKCDAFDKALDAMLIAEQLVLSESKPVAPKTAKKSAPKKASAPKAKKAKSTKKSTTKTAQDFRGMSYREAQAFAKKLREQCDKDGVSYDKQRHTGWDNVRAAIEHYEYMMKDV